MITVAVVNTKGGVGKTTLTAALAVRAAQEKSAGGTHLRVAMVDMDPQKSLIEWWQRRRRTLHSEVGDNPTMFEGPETAFDAVERAELAGYDWLFLDGPPAFLAVVQEMVEAADFVLIPVKPSMMDLLASEDAVALAREAGATHACVFNDVGPRERIVDKARAFLLNASVRILDSAVVHRASHINAMTVGKSAAEGKDQNAAREIDALWREVKAVATNAKRAKAKKEPAHG